MPFNEAIFNTISNNEELILELENKSNNKKI